MDREILNAVARLERAGAENSRATKKLHTAAARVAKLIIAQVPARAKLPRGYSIQQVHSQRCGASADYLILESGSDEYGNTTWLWIDGSGGYFAGDFNCPVPSQTRKGSLRFAADIATGLLDEIAAWLEERVATAEAASLKLEHPLFTEEA